MNLIMFPGETVHNSITYVDSSFSKLKHCYEIEKVLRSKCFSFTVNRSIYSTRQ